MQGTRIPLRTHSWAGAERPKSAASRRGGALFTNDPMLFASDMNAKAKGKQREQSNPPTLPSTPEPSAPATVPVPVKAETASAVSNPAALLPPAPAMPALDPMQFLIAALAGTTGNQQLLTLLSSIDAGSAPNPDVAQILTSLLTTAAAAAAASSNIPYHWI